MKTSSVLAAISMASLGAATDMLLPLYIYPTTGAWDSVYNAIQAYPDTLFRVIVNPNSGPGDSAYPASDYITAVAKLNSYNNVVTIGYVPVDYTKTAISTVESHISTYAGWSDYTESNITMHGIFFDEAPYEDDSTYTDYMTEAANYATNLGLDYIVFNPGTVTTAAAYYDAANLIVNQEIAYSSWSDSTVTDIPEEYRGVSAVLIHDFSSSGDISSIVSTIVYDDIAAFYATDDCCYNAIDATLLDDIASGLS